MTSREARRQRREAERKVRKSAKGDAPVLRAFDNQQKAEISSQIAERETVPSPAALAEDAAERLRAETNRQNSLRSTGPRTPQGKLASSRNSFKHGLYSKALVLPSEDPDELDALKADLRAEHQPGDTTEEILVNELAEHFWRIRRMRRYETEALFGDTKYENWFSLMALIGRTMASAERGFHKALTTLRQMQKARGFVPQIVVAAVETATNTHFVPQKTESLPPDEEPTFAERFAELKEFEEILTSRAA